MLLEGLARDGGLYVPASWPAWSAEDFRALRGLPYAEIAQRVMRPFVGESVDDRALGRIVCDAYGTFRHRAVAPLVQLGENRWLMELFHGPTLAFKDVAMQVLARLYDHALEKRGGRLTVVGATSGDTGSAAIEAFRHADRCDIFIMHPHQRTSEVQRRQMTTVDSPNVHNLAIDGTFDDCQDLLKAMFTDAAFRDAVSLSGVNSINWARVLPQVVYYIAAGVALGAPDREVAFCVPTGNFGDVYAGYVAKRMGLPVARFVVASNSNDILTRALASGDHTLGGVEPTLSPSMDIQVSSNFERLLFDAYDRDGHAIRDLMGKLKTQRGFTLDPQPLERIRRTSAATASMSSRPSNHRRNLSATPRCSSTPTPPWDSTPPTRPDAPASRPRHAPGHPRHRPPRQVPRCRRQSHRQAARPCPSTSPTCTTARNATTASPPTSGKCSGTFSSGPTRRETDLCKARRATPASPFQTPTRNLEPGIQTPVGGKGGPPEPEPGTRSQRLPIHPSPSHATTAATPADAIRPTHGPA